MDNAAYPFLAFSGIPSVSFRFTPGSSVSFPSPEYPYLGTMQDTRERLNSLTSGDVTRLAEIASQFAGHIALRLVHDHVLGMSLTRYHDMIHAHVFRINKRVKDVRMVSSSVVHADSDCGSVRLLPCSLHVHDVSV